MAVARDLKDGDNNVICVIGDGAMSAGMAYEAMNNAGALDSRLIVILNDNGMSIAPGVGALTNYLSWLISSRPFLSLRDTAKQLANKFPSACAQRPPRRMNMPVAWCSAARCSKSSASIMSARSTATTSTCLSRSCRMCAMRIQLGPDPAACGDRKRQRHIRFGTGTRKNTTRSQSSIPETGAQNKAQTERAQLHQGFRPVPDQGGGTGRQHRRHHCRHAVGTGLDLFSERFPERSFDVGIAEQHAVTFAAGLATEGLKPFAAIYSTFLQRAYDQIVHDVALQKLPVRFAIDRAGLGGPDGPTHAGSFDVAYLGCSAEFRCHGGARRGGTGAYGGHCGGNRRWTMRVPLSPR